MVEQPEVSIVGVGARASGGLNALQLTMSIRADYMAPQPCHMIDKHGEEVALCRVRTQSDAVFGGERYAVLATPALREAVAALSPVQRRGTGALPVMLALPSPRRPGFDAQMGPQLLQQLQEHSGVVLDHDRSRCIMAGRGGGVMAFEQALSLLHKGVPLVLVGGVDSYFDPDAIEALDEAYRLHSLEAENGFIPGEGAAFALLSLGDESTRIGRILRMASGSEPRPYGSDEPSTGVGMTDVLNRLLEGPLLTARSIRWLVTDVVNERHRVDELSYAATRVHRAFSQEPVHDQPLLRIGDVGAASAAMCAALAVTRWTTRCAPADSALLMMHSDGPERGAMLLGAR